MDRRRALQLSGAAALAGAGVALFGPPGPPTRSAPLAGRPDRAAIVDRLRRTPTADIVPAVVDLFARGVTCHGLLEALFVAPVLTGSDAGDVHATLAIEPVRRAIASPGLTPTERRLTTLWAAAHAIDWLRDDRPPPPPPGAPPPSAHAARRAVPEAIATGDPTAADRAVVDCLTLAGLDATLRALALAGLDAPTDPHRLIYLEQAARGVVRFGVEPAPVLRSVARYMARTALPPDSRLDPPPRPGEPMPPPPAVPDPATTAWLLDGLADDPRLLEAQDAPSEPAWHALTVRAARALRATPAVSGAGAHVVSLVHAARGAFDRAADAAERRFVLTRAARWVVGFAPAVAGDPPSSTADSGAALEAAAVGGSDPHDFKAVVALVDLGVRLPPRWRPEVAAALAATRVIRAPEPWGGRPEARALLCSALPEPA